MEIPAPAAPNGRLRKFAWRVVVYFHLVAAAFAWWLLPGGFPVGHPRFWTNEVAPFVAIAACVAGLWGERRADLRLRAAAAVTIPVFWCAGILCAGILYPHSARRFLPPALFCFAAIAAVFLVNFRKNFPRRAAVLSGSLATLVAAAIVLSLRGGESSTLPANAAIPTFEPGVETRLAALPVTLGSVSVQPAAARVVLRDRAHNVEILPLLTFTSRSPDRFWTIFAPKRDRSGPEPQLTAAKHDESSVTAAYRDDGQALLRVSVTKGTRETEIESFSQVSRPVYSHLNSFVSMTIFGCDEPALSFSPCPEIRVEVEPYDYPFGRPLRLAYVDSDDRFHVVTARSGEKGPFTELGSGHLARAESLTITLFDGTSPVLRFALDDWAAQAGRDLSPTAGWGLPVNAIEFCRVDDSYSGDGPVTIWATLAGTSVGRGWDSVGHAAGTYRNRMRVEWLDTGADRSQESNHE